MIAIGAFAGPGGGEVVLLSEEQINQYQGNSTGFSRAATVGNPVRD